jgi:hypothetical protein
MRKKELVVCGMCKTEYLKRLDTMKNWSGFCRTCCSKKKLEDVLSKKAKRQYKSCALCSKSTKSIGKSNYCGDCYNKNKPKGDKHWRWFEDRSKLKKDNKRNDSAYGEWRKLVWIRDGFECQLKDETCLGRIEVHHIHEWATHKELRYCVKNGITLCKKHHPRKKKDVLDMVDTLKKIVNDKNILN